MAAMALEGNAPSFDTISRWTEDVDERELRVRPGRYAHHRLLCMASACSANRAPLQHGRLSTHLPFLERRWYFCGVGESHEGQMRLGVLLPSTSIHVKQSLTCG